MLEERRMPGQATDRPVAGQQGPPESATDPAAADRQGVLGLAADRAGTERQGAPGLATAGALCRGLRWNGLFVDSPPDPTIPNPDDGFCWCRHTLTCLGPDGRVAEAAACRPGRRCYEAP